LAYIYGDDQEEPASKNKYSTSKENEDSHIHSNDEKELAPKKHKRSKSKYKEEIYVPHPYLVDHADETKEKGPVADKEKRFRSLVGPMERNNATQQLSEALQSMFYCKCLTFLENAHATPTDYNVLDRCATHVEVQLYIIADTKDIYRHKLDVLGDNLNISLATSCTK
jgi:hypothetical protein